MEYAQAAGSGAGTPLISAGSWRVGAGARLGCAGQASNASAAGTHLPGWDCAGGKGGDAVSARAALATMSSARTQRARVRISSSFQEKPATARAGGRKPRRQL